MFLEPDTSALFGAPPQRSVRFVVYGKAVPQGSSKAFIPKGWTRAVITSDNKRLKPWRQEVASTAVGLNLEPFVKGCALAIVLDFYFEKPPSVSKRRIHPTVKPDLDKVCRSLFDSLTGILFADDAQIVDLQARKHYGLPERVDVQISEVL